MKSRPFLLFLLLAHPAAALPDLAPESVEFKCGNAPTCADPVPRWVRKMFFWNHGPDDFRGTLHVAYFHETDGIEGLSPGDVEIARTVRDTGLLPPGRLGDVADFDLGPLPFPELPIHYEIDPDGLIAEADETNNHAIAGFPCSEPRDPMAPLPDLVLVLDSVVMEAAPFPDCAVAVVTARALNVGSVTPAGLVEARADVPAGTAVTLLPPAPGAETPFVMRVPVPLDSLVWIHLNDDGSGVPPIRECTRAGIPSNNACSFWAGSSAIPTTASPVGDSLRATAHGDPEAAIITGEFNWLLDSGAPRPAGDGFLIRQSRAPDALTILETTPLRIPRFTSATPRQAGTSVLFLQVVAGASCGRTEP